MVTVEGLGTSRPSLDPAQERLLVESRSRLRLGLLDRELAVELAAALLFCAAALALWLGSGDPGALEPAVAVGLVAAYALASRIEFRVSVGWTDPTQLVLVPMLLLLPAEAVPLLVAAALLLARLPEYRSGDVHGARTINRVADASCSLWPALVLVAFGASAPAWEDWPVYALALGAQIACDGVVTVARASLGAGLPAGTVAREYLAVSRVDVLLAPAGVLFAFGAAGEPLASLLLVPLLAVLAIFAREREARLESAFALSDAYRGTALLLSEVLSTTDAYTGSHSRSVVVLAHQVGSRLGMDESELRDVEFGALLHDVGKISVPDDILNKPGRLTDEEMDRMRLHTLDGERMLARIGGTLSEAGVVVRSHHERWDGNGYPDGLRGEEIPLAARVITACDAFNAMTTDRPYRAAMPIAEAVGELRREAGRQFDPRVVDALVEIVESWDAGADEPDRPRAAA